VLVKDYVIVPTQTARSQETSRTKEFFHGNPRNPRYLASYFAIRIRPDSFHYWVINSTCLFMYDTPSCDETVMGLREEIDKLVEAERTKRVLTGLRHRELAAEQKSRFRAMKAIFEEFAKSVDGRYVDTVLEDSQCTVRMGTRQDNEVMRSVMEWKIEPNAVNDTSAPGFRIEEIGYGNGYDIDFRQETYVVADEKEVMSKLLRSIVPYLGTYRWIQGLRDGSNLKIQLQLNDREERSVSAAASPRPALSEAPLIRIPIAAERRTFSKLLWYGLAVSLVALWLANRFL
jgi:hypothetical protein